MATGREPSSDDQPGGPQTAKRRVVSDASWDGKIVDVLPDSDSPPAGPLHLEPGAVVTEDEVKLAVAEHLGEAGWPDLTSPLAWPQYPPSALPSKSKKQIDVCTWGDGDGNTAC